jgi:hypothetical protein
MGEFTMKKVYRPSQKPLNRGPARFGALLAIFAGVLVLGVTSFLLLRPKSSAGGPSGSFTPQVKGAPHLQADKQQIDLGNVKLGQTVQVSFEITNTGDQPLRFANDPFVEVVEGC